MKRNFFFIFFLLSSNPVFVEGAEWKSLQTGFDYQHFEAPRVHFFRFDPKKYHPQLVLASDYGQKAMTVADYRKKSKSLLVINGGFFDPDFHSLGLMIREGKIMQSLRETSWGIFLFHPKYGSKILSRSEWNPQKASQVSMALQVGPRLVIAGKIPSFKDSSASRRSAIGITPDGHIEIALSETPLTLNDWAEILKKDCPQALNLDGGGSSQVSARIGDFTLEVAGATTVPNGVSIVAR